MKSEFAHLIRFFLVGMSISAPMFSGRGRSSSPSPAGIASSQGIVTPQQPAQVAGTAQEVPATAGQLPESSSASADSFVVKPKPRPKIVKTYTRYNGKSDKCDDFVVVSDLDYHPNLLIGVTGGPQVLPMSSISITTEFEDGTTSVSYPYKSPQQPAQVAGTAQEVPATAGQLPESSSASADSFVPRPEQAETAERGLFGDENEQARQNVETGQRGSNLS